MECGGAGAPPGGGHGEWLSQAGRGGAAPGLRGWRLKGSGAQGGRRPPAQHMNPGFCCLHSLTLRWRIALEAIV